MTLKNRQNTLLSVWKALLTLIFLSSLAGCTQPPPPPAASPTPTPMVDQKFEHESLPEQVKELSGTALFSVAPELASEIEGEGAFFIMLSTADPSKGVLVKAGGTYSPEQVAQQDSGIVKVSGPVGLRDEAGLAKFVSDNYSITLSQKDGKVQVVDNQADLGFKVEDDKAKDGEK